MLRDEGEADVVDGDSHKKGGVGDCNRWDLIGDMSEVNWRLGENRFTVSLSFFRLPFLLETKVQDQIIIQLIPQ